MNTDKEIYHVFRVLPEGLFRLARLPFPGPRKMASETVKALQRTMDGLVIPDDPTAPLIVLEIQFQKSKDIYGRLMIEMVQVQLDHEGRAIQGIIIFAHRSLDPKTKPWNQVVRTIYLNEELAKLEKQDPTHPLVAVFKPVFTANGAELENEAAINYKYIQSNRTLNLSQREALCEVFVQWMTFRFQHKTSQEMALLLNFPDIRDTRCGKELLEEGQKRGRMEASQRLAFSMVNGKFGAVSSRLSALLRRLTEEQIEALMNDVFSMNTKAELEKWLKSRV